MSDAHIPRVLSIAGTDPSGGAGTAADMKAITSAGGFGMTVVTSLVAQNTTGVRTIHTPPIDFLKQQLAAVSDDVELDAVKTGMLGTSDIINTVSAWISTQKPAILVVDPVMVASSGDRLIDAEAEEAMRRFCRQATVITPNLNELAVLLGEEPATTEADAVEQGKRWAAANGTSIVVKTGHLTHTRWASNFWVTPGGQVFEARTGRCSTKNTHGTGCSLASALTARLAAGNSPEQALRWATNWLHEAIAHSDALHVGHGHGPVDHSHRARRLARAADAHPWVPAAAVPTRLETPADLPQDAAAPLPRSAQPAGPWTTALWRAAFATWDRVRSNDFVRALIAGDLAREAFDFYLGQDALYLVDYSRALASVGAKAPTTASQIFWYECAAGGLTTERQLHEGWLGDHIPRVEGPVTNYYTSFLLASAAEPYVVGAAAVLPCAWLYAETGAEVPSVEPDHPYAAWLDLYHSDEFVELTATELGYVEEAFDAATPTDRARAAHAFLQACRHELEFFDQGMRLL